MTLEGKIRRALDEYDDAMKSLNAGYEFGFKWLPTNEMGEVLADKLLELNMWKVEQENKIKADLIAAVMQAEGRV